MDMTSLESKIKKKLPDLDALQGIDCLNDANLGRYAEGNLPAEERQMAEEHLCACLFCLQRLNEMQELLSYQKEAPSLSPDLARRLRELQPHQNKKPALHSLAEQLKRLFTFTPAAWKYSAIGMTCASVLLAIVISLLLTRQNDALTSAPTLNANSFVSIRALDDAGRVLRKTQGVVMNPKGLVASNLTSLVGASALQVVLKDGTTYQTNNIWKDEDKNLAVMKIGNDTLPAIPTADVKEATVGETVFVVTDPSKARKGFQESLISDFKQLPGRHGDGGVQYIQLATLDSKATKGALVDKQGRLIGMVITEEKHINMAAPVEDVEKMAKEGKSVPLSELKKVSYSTEALNQYMKGILARDALKWEDAERHFLKALKLNPRLDGVHLELGYVYYKRGRYDLEGREYEAALKAHPDNSAALLFLAENQDTRGLYREAIANYERVIAIDPANAEAYYQLGLAYLAQGEPHKALAIYPKLKSVDSGNAELLKRLSQKSSD